MFNNIEDYEYKTGKRFYTTLARVAMKALDWDKHNKMLDDGVIDDIDEILPYVERSLKIVYPTKEMQMDFIKLCSEDFKFKYNFNDREYTMLAVNFNYVETFEKPFG
jgi:hypothetical protein